MQAQDLQLRRGDLLSSRSSNYLVQDFLGEGTFGRVTKCVKMDTNKTVAIKIMKSHPDAMRCAKHEVSILKKLRTLDPDRALSFVSWRSCFEDKGRICLEFEMLDLSLQEFLKQRGFRGLSLTKIRPIVHQLATALQHLKSAGIMHTDLKLDNIMMVDHLRQPLKVKIIDFGSACQTSEAGLGSYIQSRWYRAPEIMLGLPFTEAIDVWSLGCVAAGLFLGRPLFPGKCQYEMLRYIVQTTGQLPDHLLRSGSRAQEYFCRNTSANCHLWRLKTPAEYFKQTGFWSAETLRACNSLDDLKQLNLPRHQTSGDNVAEILDRRKFVDMLKGMLQVDANQRITPGQLLEHPFLSMSHLVDIFNDSPHVQSCFKVMDICQRQRLRNTVSQSTPQTSQHQQASSSTACLAHHSKPVQVHPAGLSGLAQPIHQSTNQHPSTTTKRKRSSPVQGNCAVALPVSTERHGSQQTATESDRGMTQARTHVKRRRIEVPAGENGSKRKRAKLTCGEDRHSARDTAQPASKRARVSGFSRDRDRAQSTARPTESTISLWPLWPLADNSQDLTYNS